MTEPWRKHLIADLVRAEYPDAVTLRLGPAADTPVVLAEDIDDWVSAQAHQPKNKGVATTVVFAEMFEGPLALAPPMYEEFWVEGRFWGPEHYLERDVQGYHKIAAQVVSRRWDDGTWTVISYSWVLNQNGLQPPALGLSWSVDNEGRVNTHTRPSNPDEPFLRWEMRLTPWSRNNLKYKQRPDGAVEMSEAEPAATGAVWTAGFVIATCAFALCRNVTPAKVERNPKVEAKRARSLGLSEPLESVSRITLPGSARNASGARLGAAVGSQELPVHLVRAHPKTYKRREDGTGGLGRGHAEGTWLWSPQVRGNRRAGARHPVVTVKPPGGEQA